MSLEDKLKIKLKEYMKAKDKIGLSTVRMALSALSYEKLNKSKDDLSQSEEIKIIKTEIKKRKESLQFANDAQRSGEAETLKREISILEEFLPKQFTEGEIDKIIKDIKESNPQLTLQDVMKHLNQNYPGQFDGKLASQRARELLS